MRWVFVWWNFQVDGHWQTLCQFLLPILGSSFITNSSLSLRKYRLYFKLYHTPLNIICKSRACTLCTRNELDNPNFATLYPNLLLLRTYTCCRLQCALICSTYVQGVSIVLCLVYNHEHVTHFPYRLAATTEKDSWAVHKPYLYYSLHSIPNWWQNPSYSECSLDTRSALLKFVSPPLCVSVHMKEIYTFHFWTYLQTCNWLKVKY